LEHTESRSFRELIKNGTQLAVSVAKSVDFMKNIVKFRVMLESSFSRVAEDIRHNSFLMEILAPLTIRTIASLVVLLAGLGLVLDVGQDFGLKFMSTMSKTTLVAKLALALQLPILAHFSLVLSLVVLNEKTSFLSRSEVLLLRLNINLKGRAFRTTVSGVDARN